MDGQDLKLNLGQFTGSETIFFHSLNRRINYTEGVRFFAQNAGNGAYWLLDILATQSEILQGVAEHGFCVVILKVVGTVGQLTVARDFSEDAGAFEDDTYTRAIDFTDCPEGTWKFYFVDNVIMLPSEY